MEPIQCSECGIYLDADVPYAWYGSEREGYALCIECDARDPAETEFEPEPQED